MVKDVCFLHAAWYRQGLWLSPPHKISGVINPVSSAFSALSYYFRQTHTGFKHWWRRVKIETERFISSH